MNKFSIIIILVFCSFFNLKAQIMSFSSEPEKYLKEVQSYLGVVNKVDAKQFAKEFEPIWLSSNFSADQRAQIYSTSNLMAQKRLKAYPDFRNYLDAVKNFAISGRDEQDFNQWHETINKVMGGREKKRIAKYIETCSSLFSDNTVYKSSSTTWKANSSNYTFKFTKEPVIEFGETNLRCYSKKDSSVIYKTSGLFYPLTNKWVGTGGVVTWERAGLSKDTVYAELSKYYISLKTAGFVCDSTKYHSRYFQAPILGKLSEKVLSNLGENKVKYPSFESYDKRLVIKNIFENVDYDGGFTIRGKNLQGSGTIDNLARLIFRYKNEDFLVVESINFTINDDLVSSEKSKIKIYIDNDSITHPGTQFKFVNKNGKVTIIRGGSGISESPFYNSYHQLDMYTEAIYWKLGDPVLNFAPLFGSTDISAHFDSFDFFDKNIYDQLTGMGLNPLVQINNFSNQYGNTTFPVADLASFMRSTKSDLEFMLFNLTTKGFVNFDIDRQLVTIKTKLYNYIESRKGERDFDVIVINSNNKKNAQLNLLSKDLTINGVKKIALSNAQFVRIYPDKEVITIKKNRDMAFSGIINSGRTEYFGNEFSFNYDEFKINLIQCDSMRLRAINDKPNGGNQIRLLSTIENLKGDILIDLPTNKCGLDTSNHDYPLLSTTEKSYVYYDKPTIQGGLYKRDSFLFIIEPFNMDSLDDFTNDGINFPGLFKSAGIFPDFEEELTLQDDYSLGFKRETPSDGFNIYGIIANYNNKIKLSNKGLQGEGSISYLTSVAESEEITFYPDSVTAIAQHYTNQPNEIDPIVPLVRGEDCFISYVPKKEVLYASSNKDDIVFFENEDATLHGRLALRPNGMTGEGLMYFGKGEMLSYTYKYLLNAINADTSEFKLNTMEEQVKEMAFKTENVNAHVDFTTRKGEFKSNSGESFVEFPDNQYICYMDQFNWYMDNDDLEMESRSAGDINIDTDLDLSGSNFFSIHPDQDSLNFKSPKARFDIKKKRITCDRVQFVTVADAQVFPDSSRLIIKKRAKIKTLNNAKIVANYITKYHEIYDAKVDIKARRDYVASGTLDYTDENDKKQPIYFSYIHPDTSFTTTAKGSIKEDVEFTLNPYFEYHGDVEMYASVKNLSFKGETRIVHSCENIQRSWIKFDGSVDPNEVYIPIDTVLVDIEGDVIGTGIILNNTDSISLYTTFLSKKLNAEHLDIISSFGFIHFNKKENEYQISNKEKLAERSLPGNFISLNINNCKIEGTGQFDFGSDLGQVMVKPVGEIKYNPAMFSTDIKSSLMVNFPFSDDAFDKLAKELNEKPNLRTIDLINSTYEYSLRELVGLKQADKMISDLTIQGKVKKFPESLETSFYFGDIRFRWDFNKKAYVSYGDIGIANIKKKQVMKYVKGKVVVFKRVTGDEISIYLEPEDDEYYFFNYKRGLMQVFTSNEEFNTIILETKKDDTKFKGGKEVEDYQFMMGSKTFVTAFRRSFFEQ